MSGVTTILKDRYEIERELGRGGMSVVYLARDRQLMSKRVVIKVLLEETAADAWVRQKFQQEMEAMARIDHPGVIGVLDTGTTPEGKQFLVMQYVEGATLRSAMEPGGMNLVRAAGLIRQVGLALAAAHEKGVWHRDLKPENIMLQRLGGEDHIKLIDFGIAGIKDSAFGGEATKVAGSLTYMAPEQFAGRPSAASDTYALAVTAYEMLTGKKAFYPDSMVHLASPDQARPRPPGELRPELPEAAGRAIMRGMSFRPEDRQPSASAFSEELARALAPGTAGATEFLPVQPAAARRWKLPWLAAAVLALVVAVAAGWFLLRPRKTIEVNASTKGAQTVAGSAVPGSNPPLELDYSMLVQKASEKEPHRLAGETVFDRDDSIALQVFSPKAGYLYILNYAKDGASGPWTFNLLEPRHAGSAGRAAGEAVRIPPSRGFTFDDATGRETLYLVWASQPVADLERLKLLPAEQGVVVVKDPDSVRNLQSFLERFSSQATAERETQVTAVRTTADVLVHAVALEHL